MYVQSGSPLENYAARMNGVSVPVVEKDGTYLVEVPLLQAGEVRLDFFYNGGKHTHADLLVINGERDLLAKRVEFIRTHQQMKQFRPTRGSVLTWCTIMKAIVFT